MDKRRIILRAMASAAAGGGVRKPADPDSILQWLTAYDGVTPFVDNKSIVDSPVCNDVNCLAFDVTQQVQLPVKHDFIQQTGVFKISFCAKRADKSAYHRVFYPVGDLGSGVTGWRVQFQTGNDDINIYIANNGSLISTTNFPTGVDTTAWHRYELIGDGETISCYINGVKVSTVANINTSNLGGSQFSETDIGSSSSSFNGLLSDIRITGEFDSTYNFAEGEGLPQDASGNGNHATACTATWTTTDGIESANLLNGFYVATQGAAPYIPALIDGSGLAANGLPLTNLGGYVHNGAECSTIETDADYAIFGGANDMGNGVDTWNPLSYADYLASESNDRNVWYNWVSINGVCHLKERFAYDVTKVLTEAEYEKNVRYIGSGTGCGGIAPYDPANALKDSEGEFILDSNGEYIYTTD